MNRFIERHRIRPVIDPILVFEDAPATFDFMEDGDFMGKIVIRVHD
jgi:NADPH:quinone reductase-like Zn-dependent oxidoreductase